jgi:hypothetical protein
MLDNAASGLNKLRANGTTAERNTRNVAFRYGANEVRCGFYSG